ncbi:MAG: hypothetical protein U0R50_01885 [Gaiellales bacterium]
MSPRARVILVTGAAAVLAAAGAVAVGALQGDQATGDASARPKPKEGRPPLALALGVRDDAEAQDLARGARLYRSGQLAQATAVFDRYSSLEARIGSAFAHWPDHTLERLNQLAALHPKSAAVALHLGLADYWAGGGSFESLWRDARTLEPDTPYAVTADNLLYPSFARNLPVFVTEVPLPASLRRLSPAAQLDLLGTQASDSTDAALRYGAFLQTLGRRLSAERVYRRAAAAAPNDPEAQTAAAFGLFDKAAPAEAFSRLGPLSRRYPESPTVRFHLGLLLLWSGSFDAARTQFEKARLVEPSSRLATEAKRYLDLLARR